MRYLRHKFLICCSYYFYVIQVSLMVRIDLVHRLMNRQISLPCTVRTSRQSLFAIVGWKLDLLILTETYKYASDWKQVTKWCHKNVGLSISFFGVFFFTSPLISLIFMTLHGSFLRHFVKVTSVWLNGYCSDAYVIMNKTFVRIINNYPQSINTSEVINDPQLNN